MQVIVCACALLYAPCGDTTYPLPHDVIIHEIMTDPSPPVALPEYEFIELKNTSSRTIDLAGWKVRGNGGSATLPAFALAPGGYVVVAPRRGAAFFQPVVDAGSFFALHNDEDLLFLEAPSGHVIHAVAVEMRRFSGSFKSAGGWSLEMIDPAFPCAGPENWAFSNDPSGGTPGKLNSVAAPLQDPPLPVLLRCTWQDSLHVRLHFSGPVSPSADVAAFASERPITNAHPEPPLFNTVLLRLAEPLPEGALFQLRTLALESCDGRPLPPGDFIPAGRPSGPAGIVVSEILPDPITGTDDFIEIYNNGAAPIDLQALRFSTKADDSSWRSLSPVIRRPYLLFPGQFLALSPGPEALCRQYACLGAMEYVSLPALSAESGQLGLFALSGALLDEVTWDRKRHSPELSVTKGVAFERLDMGISGLEPGNWHSAASTAGFATPGYANSHRVGRDVAGKWCSAEPAAFSPDNNGVDDLLWISWGFPAPGFRLDIRIFDAAGRQVRHLADQVSAADKGKISWNGLGDSGLPLPRGTYALRIAAWNADGKQLVRKLAVVLLRD
ncbi:lamin tail domain-containing protein [Chitinophaga pollutisoli]|uniref:Lamin tail domain-containing protein n=1 Tax=Chitinophaga pollutisoli TaxID=3133966 RepID=A0ABZ2YX78_9BACT